VIIYQCTASVHYTDSGKDQCKIRLLIFAYSHPRNVSSYITNLCNDLKMILEIILREIILNRSDYS